MKEEIYVYIYKNRTIRLTFEKKSKELEAIVSVKLNKKEILALARDIQDKNLIARGCTLKDLIKK